VQVLAERPVRVIVGRVALEHDTIPFKELVGLVAGQEKGEAGREELNSAPLRHLPIVLEGSLVRPDQLAKAHKRMEANQQEDKEQEIVVTRGGHVAGTKSTKLSTPQRAFASRGNSAEFLAAAQSLGDEGVTTMLASVWIVALELVADAREVRVDRRGLDVVRHVNDVETKCVGGRVDWKVVGTAERDVGVQGGRVRGGGGSVNGVPERNSALMQETLAGPGNTNRLPGRMGG
jgi:hypothetical protein